MAGTWTRLSSAGELHVGELLRSELIGLVQGGESALQWGDELIRV